MRHFKRGYLPYEEPMCINYNNFESVALVQEKHIYQCYWNECLEIYVCVGVYKNIHMYMVIYMYVTIHMCIYREREGERERNNVSFPNQWENRGYQINE